jgi:hypothetical protein
MLAADEDLAKRIVEIAKKRDSTVYQTVNDILEQAVKVESMGLSLNDIIENREKLEKARKMGMTFTIEKLLFNVFDIANNKSEKELSELFHDTGKWYGKYFQGRNGDPLEIFKEAMDLLTFGGAVFNYEKMNGGQLSITCVGELFTDGYSQVQSLFIEGVLEALGWKQIQKETPKGIIRLIFERER